MKELSVKEVKKVQLELLLFFHNLCQENNLTYYMSNGTLLGAVKYSGYIPWDDDIDVCMPRQDYCRLMEILKANDLDEYKMFSTELNSNYLFPFAKLCDSRTVLIEGNVDNGVTLGVNIDIFPLDGFGNNEEQVIAIYKKMSRLRSQLMWAKYKVDNFDSFYKKTAKMLISSIYKIKGAKRICREISDLAKSRDFAKDQYVGNSVWGFYYPGEAHNNNIFSSKVSMKFEGYDFWAPTGYDEFLRKLYGDYIADPPPEKQITHHSFKAYRKDGV